MYKSPVEVLMQDVKMQVKESVDEQVYHAVASVGINVDKTELLRALAYDRNQYAKGYSDGQAEVMESIVYCKECEYWKKCQSSLVGEVMCCTGQGISRIQKHPGDFCSCGKRKEEKEDG